MSTIQNPFNSAPISTAKLFWLCAGVYALAWIIVPALSIATIPIDTLEGYAWGHEWQLGTYKHPPLAGWVLEALAVITDRASWACFLANELSVIVAFWAVWQTGRRITSETGALVGALLLAVIPYYNIIIPEFNPNVLQLPFWALICWSFYKAVKDNKALDWILLGVWAAASMYTKYSSALLLASLAGLIVYHPEARKRLRSIGPLLTAFIALLLMLPHVIWLVQSHFMPFVYAQGRFEQPPHGLPAFLIIPALFIFWQAATVLPAIILYAVSFAKRPIKSAHSFDKTFLCFITFGPAIIAVIAAIISGGVIRNMWATPFWNFIGLWAVVYFQPDFSAKNMRRFATTGCFLFTLGLVGFFCVEYAAPYITHKAKRINFSGPAIAAQISQSWHQHYNQPLRYVIGDTWIGGVIAFYAPDRPHQLTDGNDQISPWVNPADIKKYGAVIAWCGEHCDQKDTVSTPAYIAASFPQAQIQPPLVIPQATGAKVPNAMVEWAILPPQAP